MKIFLSGGEHGSGYEAVSILLQALKEINDMKVFLSGGGTKS